MVKMEVQKIEDKQSSISISRTSKGAYLWDCKIYYNTDRTSYEDVIKTLNEIDKMLNDQFGKR